MIEVLVSDLGQVVLPFDWAPCKAFLRERSRRHAADREFDPWAALASAHDRLGFGKGACESEPFFHHVSGDLDLDATYEEFCTAWSDVFWEDRAVMDLIGRAHVPHKFLLSNTNAVHWKWILERHGESLQVFDRLLASQELGAEKPHAAIYRKVEGLTGLPPEAHLMIDDIAENIEGACACGWDGIVHTDAANLELELRRRSLLP